MKYKTAFYQIYILERDKIRPIWQAVTVIIFCKFSTEQALLIGVTEIIARLK